MCTNTLQKLYKCVHWNNKKIFNYICAERTISTQTGVVYHEILQKLYKMNEQLSSIKWLQNNNKTVKILGQHSHKRLKKIKQKLCNQISGVHPMPSNKDEKITSETGPAHKLT